MYDLVVRGGRVIDPESGHDGIADVGIKDGRIEAIDDKLGPARQIVLAIESDLAEVAEALGGAVTLRRNAA